MAETDPVKTLVKHVGRGKTLARDLSPAQAQDAMGRILRGEFSPAQLGAFLQAMRIKETTAQELVHAAMGCEPFRMSADVPNQPPADRFPLVVNLGFDTARKGGVLSLLAAAFLRRAGLAEPLVVWEPAVNFVENDSLARTLSVLRSHPELSQGECPMVSVQEMFPAWEGLRGVRKELGFRSILNTLEKLLRPWATCPVVVGISHDTFSERLCHVLFALGAPRGVVVQGNHGTCDLTLGEKPMETTAWVGSDVSDRSVSMSEILEDPDGSILLVSRQEEWSAMIRDEASPLWRAVRGQAAYLLSVARGIQLPEAVRLVAQHPPVAQGAAS
jgi:anthranilate phosphoribosyltransferase